MRNLLLGLAVVAALGRPAAACVGKSLTVGVPTSDEAQLLAELISVLVNERTGTTINVVSYTGPTELYGALKKGEVSILVERADLALERAGRPAVADPMGSYAAAKAADQEGLGLVWMAPLGVFSVGGRAVAFAPVLTSDVMTNFPVLPRVLNKLGQVLSDAVFAKLLQSVKSGDKPKKVAREFLQAKRLI